MPPFDPGFLSSHLESKSTGTEIDCSIILPVVLGCVNWSLALREESGLRIFERKVPRKVKGLKSGRAQVTGKNCIIMGITSHRIFYVLLTVHLSIILGNDQLDTQLLYFTIRLSCSSTCFENYLLIIRRLNCIDTASGIVILSKWPSGAQVEKELSSPSTCAPDGHLLRVTIPDAASVEFNLLMMSI